MVRGRRRGECSSNNKLCNSSKVARLETRVLRDSMYAVRKCGPLPLSGVGGEEKIVGDPS